MEKRALSAIVLSLLVIFVFQWYVTRNYPQSEATRQPSQYQDAHGRLVSANTFQRPSIAENPTREGGHSPQTETMLPSPIPAKEEETVVETERFIITFTNIGGSIKKIELKDYPDPEQKG